MREQLLQDEGTVVVSRAGTGERGWVVVVPGMGDLRTQYRFLAPHLVRAGYGVLAMDLRGHGDSDVTFRSYAPDAVGRDVLALLDANGIGRAVVLGNSAGAASAVWAAAEAPDRIAGIGLLGPVARNPPGFSAWMAPLMWCLLVPWWGRWAWVAFYRSLFRGGTPADHEAHVAAVAHNARTWRRRAALLANGMSDKSVCSARIGEVRAPCLVVMGSADPDFPDASAEAQDLGGMLGARVVVLEGVGHYPHMERPEATAEVVLDWLKGAAWHGA